MAGRTRLITTINGERVPPSKAVVSVFDNSLLYAQGLFETFLAFGERVVFEQEHLARLWNGARVIDMKLPVSRRQLSQWMRDTLALHPAPVKRLRLTITAGESARWVGQPGPPQVILSAADHTLPTEPYRLFVSHLRVGAEDALRNVKTISYGIEAAALKEAQKHGYDDALLVNDRGDVAEATSSNIYWTRGSTVYTPALSDGCLDGVTRGKIIDACRQLKIPLLEQTQPLDEVMAADEVLISSSLKLVLPVTEIANQNRSATFPHGPVAQRLRDYFIRRYTR